MSFSFTIATVLEVLVGLFIIWGFFHEEKFVAFEDRIFHRSSQKSVKPHQAEIIPFVPRKGRSGRGIV